MALSRLRDTGRYPDQLWGCEVDGCPSEHDPQPYGSRDWGRIAAPNLAQGVQADHRLALRPQKAQRPLPP
jgi:hypothetical protein